MDDRKTDRRALTRAAEILGGVAPLSARLRVAQERVELWIAGEERIPIGTFSVVVDIMLDNSGQQDFTKKK
jgi:hypothetical protein